MTGFLYIDGNNLNTLYDLFITDSGIYDAPARNIERISVPGKSGDLVIDKGTFANVSVRFPAFIINDMEQNADALRNFLTSAAGYRRIETSFMPDEYRLGFLSKEFELDNISEEIGTFDLEFNCKPQRFLKSGETSIEVADGDDVVNPTSFDAKPLIRIYGYGTIGIGSQTFTVASPGSDYIDIDCDMMDCFYGAVNKNSFVTFTGGEFPVLHSGTNAVSISRNITKLKITPRWWKI